MELCCNIDSTFIYGDTTTIFPISGSLDENTSCELLHFKGPQNLLFSEAISSHF